MNGGKRKLSQWNVFVKKIYHEGRSKHANYSFKQALTDASRRKGEMSHTKNNKHKSGGGGKSRKRRGTRRR